MLPLEKFSEHLSEHEMSQCQQNLRKSWYSMSVEVFTAFIFWVMILFELVQYRSHSGLCIRNIVFYYFPDFRWTLQYEIAAAADVGVRLYKEETPAED